MVFTGPAIAQAMADQGVVGVAYFYRARPWTMHVRVPGPQLEQVKHFLEQLRPAGVWIEYRPLNDFEVKFSRHFVVLLV